jgi:hypothetical protein
MRLYIKGISCGIIAMALAALGSPPAYADDASLVRSARQLGFGISAVNLISTGESACYFIGPRKRDPDEVADRIRRYGNVSPDAARQFLVLAVQEYCPQYGDRVANLG